MANSEDTKYQIKNSIITAAIAMLFSSMSAALTIAFLLGGANKDISNILEKQQEQTIAVKELTSAVTTLQISQGITNLRLDSNTKEIERIRLGFMELNEDMKCIRIAAASNGDITKC